jgi:hypothetical protein
MPWQDMKGDRSDESVPRIAGTRSSSLKILSTMQDQPGVEQRRRLDQPLTTGGTFPPMCIHNEAELYGWGSSYALQNPGKSMVFQCDPRVPRP